MKPMPEDELRKRMVETMRRANTPPEFIYAFEKTGRLVSEQNISELSAEEVAEWEEAIDEYFRKHPRAS
jgi:hypothetical protein